MNEVAYMGQSAIAKPLPFFYVMVVWGTKYVDMFLELALPCFLSAGNLPALTNRAESKFLILTTPKDRSQIVNSPNFAHLAQLIEPVFVDSPWIAQNIPYHLKAARGHRVAAEIAAQADGYCVFLCPDCMVSDGSFGFLERMARQGKHAVLTPGLRLVQETVYEELRDAGRIRRDVPLTFTGRELVAFGLRHLHPEVQRYNWENPHFAMHPHMCTWNVPGETGLLIRAFHMHPMLVSLRGATDFPSLEESTIDGEFLGHNISDWEQVHVETDSDNLLIFSLTGGDERFTPLEQNSPDVERIRAMAYSPLVNPLHRAYFTRAIKLHAGELNDTWANLEKSTAPLVYSVLTFIPGNLSYLRQVRARELFAELTTRVKWRLARTVKDLLSHTTRSH
jgi:hypothetical protein